MLGILSKKRRRKKRNIVMASSWNCIYLSIYLDLNSSFRCALRNKLPPVSLKIKLVLMLYFKATEIL
jgi:hypothetical protein